MWIVKLALNRPYTFIVLALLIFILSPFVIMRTPTDIFPNINIPVIAVAWQYTGLNPQELEGRLTTVYESALTTTVDNVEHLESTTVNGHASSRSFCSRTRTSPRPTHRSRPSRELSPPVASRTLPPLILNFSASTVPILQLALSGQGLSEQQLNDLG